MSNRRERNVKRLLRKGSGWEQGLLVAAEKAQNHVYNTSSLSQKEIFAIRDGISALGEARQYNAVLDAARDVSADISGVQTLYLQLRARLIALGGLFILFTQHQLFAHLLNRALCGKEDGTSAIRARVLSDRHSVLGGELALRTDDEAPPRFEISVSGDWTEAVYELTDKIAGNFRELKRFVDETREFMDRNAVNLKPYEDYLDGIEDELRDLTRLTICQLDGVGSETWPQVRAALEEMDDEHLKLVETLPLY